MKKVNIGLDIGISSVGWAVISTDKNNKREIEDFGTQLYDAPIDPKSKDSFASKRRVFRSARRLTRRKRERLKRLEDILFTQLDVPKNDFYNSIKERKDTLNPLIYRYLGHHEKLKKWELISALKHIARHRGYIAYDQFNEQSEISDAKKKGVKLNENEKFENPNEFFAKNKNLSPIDYIFKYLVVYPKSTENEKSKLDLIRSNKILIFSRNNKFDTKYKNFLEKLNKTSNPEEFINLIQKEEKNKWLAFLITDVENLKLIFNLKNVLKIHTEELKKIKKADKNPENSKLDKKTQESIDKCKTQILMLYLKKMYPSFKTNVDKLFLYKLFNKHVIFEHNHYIREVNHLIQFQQKFYPKLNVSEVTKIISQKRDFETGPGIDFRYLMKKISEFSRINKIDKNKIWNIWQQYQKTTDKWDEWINQNYPKLANLPANKSNTKTLSDLKFNQYQGFLNTIGKCRYYPEENRMHNASYVSDIYMFIQLISKAYRKTSWDKVNKENLKKKIFNIFINEFYDTKNFSFCLGKKNEKEKFIKKLITFLDVDTTSNFLEHLNSINKKEFDGIFTKISKVRFFCHFIDKLIFISNHKKHAQLNNTFNNLLASLNSDLNDDFSFYQFDKLGNILFQNQTPKNRIDKIQLFIMKINNLTFSFKFDIYDDKDIIKLIIDYQVNIQNRVSKKYMIEAIRSFLKGIDYNEFLEWKEKALQNQNKINLKNKQNICKKFFIPFDDDISNNPVVFRSFTQSRKIIKKLVHKYSQNSFCVANINVEIARDLSLSKKMRGEETTRQNMLNKTNNEAIEFLKKQNISISSTNIIKWKLWMQQSKLSPLSFKKIHQSDFISETQIDHIVPYSRLNDNSLNNKQLIFSHENQKKGNQLIYELFLKQKSTNHDLNYFNNLSLFNKYIDKLIKDVYKKENKKYGDWSKKIEYFRVPKIDDSFLDTFVTANLNDTRIITKTIVNWLEIQKDIFANDFNYNVLSIKGRITSTLRKALFHNIDGWGEIKKVRDISPYHHAIDALIVSLFSNKFEILFTELFINLWNQIFDELMENKLKEKSVWTDKDINNSINSYFFNAEKFTQNSKEKFYNKQYALVFNKAKDILIKQTKEIYTYFVNNSVKKINKYLIKDKLIKIINGNNICCNLDFNYQGKNFGNVVSDFIPVKLHKSNEIINNERVINVDAIDSPENHMQKLIEKKYQKQIYPMIRYKVDQKINRGFAKENFIKNPPKERTITKNELNSYSNVLTLLDDFKNKKWLYFTTKNENTIKIDEYWGILISKNNPNKEYYFVPYIFIKNQNISKKIMKLSKSFFVITKNTVIDATYENKQYFFCYKGKRNENIIIEPALLSRLKSSEFALNQFDKKVSQFGLKDKQLKINSIV